MRQRYDASSKWLIETQAGAILRLAGVGPVESWRPLPGEVVQSRQLPDGLVEARLPGRAEPVLFLIEVNTYPDNRVPGELLDDLALTYLNRRVVPEVIALTLCPKGNLRVAPDLRVTGPLGTATLGGSWRVVELWTLPASDFLPLTDPGLAPWLLLTHHDGPPEPLIQQCKDVIEARTTGGTRANLLAVTEILGGLRYDERTLQAILRGGGKMIESPVLQRWLRESKAEALQGAVLKALASRFPPVPADVSATVRLIEDEDRLNTLIAAAYTADSLDAFRTHLTTPAS
jgi:hypothetical protein